MEVVTNQTINGTMIAERLSNFDASTIYTQPWRALWRNQQHSAVLKGDMKNPLPWSYEISRLRYAKGVNTWTTTYTAGSDRGRWTVMKQSGDIQFDSSNKFFTDVSYPSWLYNSTLSKLNEKTRGSLDLAVDLAQAGQTARMFKASENLNIFINSIGARGWRNIIKGIGSARLVWVYGIKPLLSDVYAAADESLRFTLSEIEHFKVRSTDNITNTKFTLPFQYYGNALGNCRRSGRYMCEIGLSLRTKEDDPARWTSLNPASIAWELTPYSFVLDWIIDVGSYLRDIETSLLYNNRFVNGYITKVTSFDATWSCDVSRRVDQWNQSDAYYVNATASFLYRKLDRTLLSSYPAPHLPTFHAELGSSRLLNAAALLGQKLR